jgi:hypothetical protein
MKKRGWIINFSHSLSTPWLVAAPRLVRLFVVGLSSRLPASVLLWSGLPSQVKVISNIELGVEHISIIQYLIASFSVRRK